VRSSRKTAPCHTGDGFFFSRATNRGNGFLSIKPIVIFITRRLELPSTLRSRAILGTSQLIRVADRSVRARIIPEPTEALSLLRVGPDHQIPPTSDPPDMDVPFLHLILESLVAQSQLVRQVAGPPLIRPKRLRRPASGTETESVDQFPDAGGVNRSSRFDTGRKPSRLRRSAICSDV
jgi:hypothetical protein